MFQEWLAAHYPDKAEHVMSIIRQTRGGSENDPRFGFRKRGTGVFADVIAHRFALSVKRHRLERSLPPLATELFLRPQSAGAQLALI